MKNSITLAKNFIVAFTALAFSYGAHAIYLPEFQRPILGAQMSIEYSEGQFVGAETADVAIAKQDSAEFPTSILITVGTAPQMVLPITSMTKDSCGITTIVAETQIDDATYIATLRDARSNLCRIALAPWTVELKVVDSNFYEVGMMSMVGTPEPLFSIQTQQAFFTN